MRAGEDTIDVPAGYLAAGQVAHAYAVTAHKAQGSTCERSFVLGSQGLYREWAYTAMSRHRDQAHLYLTTEPEHSPEQHPETLSAKRQEPAAELAQQLNRSRGQRLASDLDAPQANPANPSPVSSNGAEQPEDPRLAREDRRRQALLEERARAVDELHDAEQRQQAPMQGSGGRRGPLRRSPREPHPAVNQESATAAFGAARWRNRIQEIDALLESSAQRRQLSTAARTGASQTVEEAFGNHLGVDHAGTKSEEDLGLDVA